MKTTECTECHKIKKLVKHHPDYSKPKEVVLLCYRCHRILHAKIKENEPGYSEEQYDEFMNKLLQYGITI